MASMIPEHCPSKATAGEQRLFRMLQRWLPDDFDVWYEPDVRQRYPDFIILGPSFGLLVIEVKGWYPKHISRADDREVELLMTREGQSCLDSQPNPLRQARDYKFRVVDLLKREALLRQPDGTHKGKLCFPCGYTAAFTNLTREQLANDGLSGLFPSGQAYCKDELESAEAASDGEQVIRLLKGCFTVSFSFQPLTKPQIRTIKGVLHPEVVVGERTVTIPPPPSHQADSAATEQARVLEVLDREQERAARSLGDGHRILFGVAGSGKTVVLLARAKLLASRHPDKKILLLCYNRCLAAYLEHQLRKEKRYRGIEVRAFPKWAMTVTQLSRDRHGEEFKEYMGRVTEGLLEATASFPEEKKYDAIFVDEAQDFQPEWFRCCTNALKGGLSGDLLIAADGAQSIYDTPRSFTWKSVGVNAQGRSRQLTVNYRNTKEIIAFAWHLARQLRQDEEETEVHVRLLPARAKRLGPKPLYQGFARSIDEHAAIARLIEHFKKQGHDETDIAVLYQRTEQDRIDNLFNSLKSVAHVCWITNDADWKAKDMYVSRPGVRLCTIDSVKGLQFPVILFSSVDQLPNPMSEGDDANLFYVGLTRARDHLVLTWSGRSAFTDQVEKSVHANHLSLLESAFANIRLL
jgi:hypothetical protein